MIYINNISNILDKHQNLKISHKAEAIYIIN